MSLPVSFSGQHVFVLGSGPGSSAPPASGWATATVNGSQALLQGLGLPARPTLTLMHNTLIKSRLHSNIAARKVLRGLATGHLVMMDREPSFKHRCLARIRLWALGYRYDTLTLLDYGARQRIIAQMLQQPYDSEQHPSNGIFLALLVLHLGAASVLMSGFSLSRGGHAYNTHNFPREHVNADLLALQRMAELGLPVFTNDPVFSVESGLPLLKTGVEYQ